MTHLVHVIAFLLLSDARHGGLRVRRQQVGLRVDHAQGTEHERLVLRGRDGRDGRVAGERGCRDQKRVSKTIRHSKLRRERQFQHVITNIK